MSARGGYTVLVHAKTLDHVAVWTPDRHALADVLVDCCGMHEIERTDDFTLVGGDARRGKLTLFDADGVRERGSLERVVLRVPDVGDARERLEAVGLDVSDDRGMPTLEAPSGLPLGLVQADETGIADLDSVVLRVRDPGAAAGELESMGLERVGDDLRVADKRVMLRGGGGPEPERPLLNHLAFLVDQADEVEEEARTRGLEIDKVVDAENTRAVFVWGPDRIKLEYVEHKPGFSLV
jgi:catechol 2,3-dioxygenase-like lactoylglutathione lyase family enzyme